LRGDGRGQVLGDAHDLEVLFAYALQQTTSQSGDDVGIPLVLEHLQGVYHKQWHKWTELEEAESLQARKARNFLQKAIKAS
jgi:hypothetical protein